MRLIQYLLALCSIALIACGGPKQEETVSWDNTTDHYLKGKTVSVKLPESFVESSRYRIQEDVPALKSNSTALEVVQKALEKYEQNDQSVDLFIDTTSQYHFVTILDTDEKISLDKSSAAKLGKVLMEDYKKMDLSKRGVEITRLESNIKKNTIQKLAKFKFEINDKRKRNKTYVTSFFITNSTRTLIWHEFSDSKDDLEYYTWSVKENY